MVEKCPICQEDLLDNIGVAIPCGHCFHRDCYEKFKQNCQQRDKLHRCCVCKKKTKRFCNIFLSFESSRPSLEKDVILEKEATLRKEKRKLEKKHCILQSLSNDQNEILTMLLRRQNDLETQCSNMKRESKFLKAQLKNSENECWELRLECYENEINLSEMKSKQNLLEMELEDTNAENKDLHDIWGTLERRLDAAKLKRKSVQSKMKINLREKCEELQTVKEEMTKLRKAKVSIERELAGYRKKAMKLENGRKDHAKKVSRARKHKKRVKYRNLA